MHGPGRSIEQSSRGSDEQRSRTAEAATAMEEMNSTVMEVARSAGTAADLADRAKGKAQQGAKLVEQVVGTINDVKAQALTLKNDMTRLGVQAEGIGQIDLSFVTIELTDKDGVFQPNANNLLHFSISGPGVIVGVGNADIKDVDPYVGTSRKAWHGRALVVVRSTHEGGDINLTVSTPGMDAVTVAIKAE